MPDQKYLLVIAGPTAVGKTALSIQLAKHFATEIISADSRQIYKELSIGTAKPTIEEQEGIRHNFIDHVSVTQRYTAGDFEKEALQKLDELFAKHQLVIMCGGSGLYIDALCNGFDEGLLSDEGLKENIKSRYSEKGLSWLQEEIKKHDPLYFSLADIKNPHRLMRALEVIELSGKPFSSFRKNKKAERNFSVIKILLNEERDLLYNKINLRVDEMMRKGLLKETEALYEQKHFNALNTVGYKELFEYLDKKNSLENAVELIKQHSRNYAKRQLTWFRKDEEYELFSPHELDKIKAFTEIILEHS